MSRLLRGTVGIFIVLMGMFGSAGLTLAAPDTVSDAALLAEGGTGTVVVSDFVCAGQEGVIWGGTPGANCEAGAAGFVFYLFGDGTDDSWALDVSGSNSIVLPAGKYEVYENVYWTTTTFELLAGGEVHLSVLHPGAALPVEKPPVEPPPPPPVVAMGTVVVSDYLCAGQEGVIWYGTPGANCVAGAADFVFYLVGDGTDDSWGLSVNGSNSRSLPAGTYEVYEGTHWTASTVTVPAEGTAYISVLHPGGKLPPPPPPPAAANGTVAVSKSICDGLESVTWGQAPDENCYAGKATFYFYLIGDGTDEYWTLHVDGSASISLAPGTYEVYEDGHWSMGKVTVTSGATTSLSVLNPGKALPPPPPPAKAKGMVHATKLVCDGQEGVIWEDDDNANCDPGSATLYFYLIGDGTDDYWKLSVVNGAGQIELPVGTYEVWESGTWSKGTVEVTAGATSIVHIQNPGAPLPPPPPATGAVEISKFVCDGQKGVIWGGTLGADCVAGEGTFHFYLVGDGSDDYWTLNVDGTDAITLAAGSYEVWESGHWTMHKVDVKAGETTAITVLNPGKPLPPPPPAMGTVDISKWVCDGQKGVDWAVEPDANCEPGEASFHFYLIGDGTDEYWTLHVDGNNSMDLKAGTYEVYEDGHWTMHEVVIEANETTVLHVGNPGDPLPPPPPATGDVTINKFVCDKQVGVVWEGTPGGDCVAGKASFYFYLIGDGSDEYWTLHVNGSGTIELLAGTYEVWENGSWSMYEVEVPENGAVTLNVLNPGSGDSDD